MFKKQLETDRPVVSVTKRIVAVLTLRLNMSVTTTAFALRARIDRSPFTGDVHGFVITIP